MTPDEIAIAIAAIVAAAAVSIGGIFLNHHLADRRKKAKIDYSIFYRHGERQYPDCVLPFTENTIKTPHGERRYASFTVSSINRGEINGFINLTLHALGARVFSSAMEEPSASSTRDNIKIVSNGKDIITTFYVLPEPGADIIRLHVTATAGKSSEVQAPYSTAAVYYKHGDVYDCNPPKRHDPDQFS